MPGTTMTASNGGLDLQTFEVLLDTYGADRERWPVERRSAAVDLLAASAVARARLAEAEALDRVLARGAMGAAVGRDALVDRILVAAVAGRPARGTAETSERGPSGVVVALPRGAGRQTPPAHVARARTWVNSGWQAAAVLALALMTGVAIGSADLFSGPLSSLSEFVGIDTEPAQTTAGLHLDSLPWVMDEEQI